MERISSIIIRTSIQNIRKHYIYLHIHVHSTLLDKWQWLHTQYCRFSLHSIYTVLQV